VVIKQEGPSYVYECLRCGWRQVVNPPCTVEFFVQVGNAFMAEHAGCGPKADSDAP
jgi:hypothetical protein